MYTLNFSDMEQSDQDHLMALAAQQEEAGISFGDDRKNFFDKTS
jgi:hypothetical protein